ncbi:MAG: hypothetical protein GY714_18695 [Desulfobacterales bacterium]|nr:hypothetical protein [Desulfobacterales bacterium]
MVQECSEDISGFQKSSFIINVKDSNTLELNFTVIEPILNMDEAYPL